MCIALHEIRIFHFWGYLFTYGYTCVVDISGTLLHWFVVVVLPILEDLYNSHVLHMCNQIVVHITNVLLMCLIYTARGGAVQQMNSPRKPLLLVPCPIGLEWKL